MTEPLNPTGFWSYTSSDDTASHGRLSQLRRLLADELQLKIGRLPKVHIFQDVAAIPHGTAWHKEIHRALAESSFFIPIVTPAYLQSEMCCQEVLRFREREAALGRDDLILPVHYISIDDLDPHRPDECHDATVLELLRSRQWIDFRPLRFRDPEGEDVALKLETLASSIRAALRRGGTVRVAQAVVESLATPAGARDTANAAALASAGPEGVLQSAASVPMRSSKRLAVWGIAGAVALLAIGTFAFLQNRAPTDQTVQRPMTQSVQPASPRTSVEPAAASVTRDCPTCPELVLMPPGNFVMGVPPEEDDREGISRSFDDHARPQHKVAIARAFWLSRYPVTRGEYAAFVQDTGYQGGGTSWREPGFPQTDRDPVVHVNSADAVAYAEWLSRKTGKAYRLPSEAEWEYAARAGTTTARFWGDDRASACRYANVADEAFRKTNQDRPGRDRYFDCDDGYANTSPVGTFKPNLFGLYDMLGNVWQWTADCYHGDYGGAPDDGSAWTTEACNRRVLRGGSWYVGPRNVRSGARLSVVADVRNDRFGFRVARTP